MPVIILLFISASMFGYSPPEMMSEALRATGKVLYDTHDLYPLSGTILQRDDLSGVTMSFVVCKPLDLESGQQLVSDILVKLRHQIDSKKEMRPYLETYPFPIEKATLSLFCKTPLYDEVPEGSLSKIIYSNGMIHFFVAHAHGDTCVHSADFPQ